MCCPEGKLELGIFGMHYLLAVSLLWLGHFAGKRNHAPGFKLFFKHKQFAGKMVSIT